MPNDDGALLCRTTIGLCCHSMQNSQQCSGSSASSQAALHFECFRFTSFALAIVSRNRQIIQFLPIERHCSRNCGLLLLLRHCAIFVREVCTTEYARKATRDELPLGCGRGGLWCAHKWKPIVIQLNVTKRIPTIWSHTQTGCETSSLLISIPTTSWRRRRDKTKSSEHITANKFPHYLHCTAAAVRLLGRGSGRFDCIYFVIISLPSQPPISTKGEEPRAKKKKTNITCIVFPPEPSKRPSTVLLLRFPGEKSTTRA